LKNSSFEQESKDSTHQKPQVSKRKMRRRKYILQLGGFSTERAAKISLVFRGLSVDGRLRWIFPEQMHGVAGSYASAQAVLVPVEKLCMLCERGHVPCHTFCLPPSRQSERIPR